MKGSFKKGFSLIEIILAVALFAIIILGAISGMLVGEQATANAGTHNRATLVAQQSLDLVRNITSTDLSGLQDGLWGIRRSPSSGRWILVPFEDTLTGFLRKILIQTSCNGTTNAASKNITVGIWVNGTDRDPMTISTSMSDSRINVTWPFPCIGVEKNSNEATPSFGTMSGVHTDTFVDNYDSSRGSCSSLPGYSTSVYTATVLNYTANDASITIGPATITPDNIMWLSACSQTYGNIGQIGLGDGSFSLSANSKDIIYFYVNDNIRTVSAGANEVISPIDFIFNGDTRTIFTGFNVVLPPTW